ncbi:MAG: DUF2779 domain-containing protein [Steroidobacteraceae bacterium]
MAWLTKSRFMAGRQCPKRLWFEVNAPLRTRAPDSMAIRQGRVFDTLMRELVPGRVIARNRGMPAAIAETTRVLAAGTARVLHQPAVRHGEFAVIADILRRDRGIAELVEVKASTQVKAEHIPDAAFQALVLRGARVPVQRVSIAHVDSTFMLERKGDYAGLASEADVTAQVEAILPTLGDEAVALHRVMAERSAPAIAMGPQCHTPWPCPFIARCSAGAPPPDLSSHRDGRVRAGSRVIDRSAADPLRRAPWPRAYLDFETIAFAVPEIIGTRPYEQLPFQWSLHVEDAAGGVQHAAYLASQSFGDFTALSSALLCAAPPAGPVFAYNASFEARALELLARLAPSEAPGLVALRARLVDLWPITKQAYYDPRMQGSWSLKAVIPTIAPELAYSRLGEVQEGEGAQLAFLELRAGVTDEARRAALETALREYCRQDTWALVCLARFLAG